jgi:GrpB-like predicted nucleotidyltransferase (UPF0157 family)
MSGVPIDKIHVCFYDPAWPRLFQAEAGRIRAAIGAYILDIQHIGSTAVPGLAAKPLIDIGVAVADFVEARRCVQPLVDLGYHCLGENGIPRRHFLVYGEPHTHHLHMNESHSFDWRQTIAFRDYLRTHPDVAAAYAALKLRLAQQFAADPDAYHAGKDAFIKQVLQAALA